MIFLVTFDYMQSSPRGGTAKHIKENKLIAVETEKELVDSVNVFLANDQSGYRKSIELLEIKRI